MKKIKTREQFEAAIQALVGLELADVTYYEIEYETQKRCYLHQPNIGHFLDFGVEFRMACGSYRSFLWDGTFYQYGIGLFPHKASLEVSTQRQWVVSDTREWCQFLGSSVESARVYWSWVAKSPATPEAYRTYYPQDIELAFTCGKHIYLSASQYSDNSDSLYGMSDDILVVFDESAAKKYCVGPHGIDA
ncbi:hypothetical protein MalM25_11380 [Planctomycetes bacterium MalM25]|nr:hypothetical protein MalM25_11380 [Planctomycetes bacterium MalM25]